MPSSTGAASPYRPPGDAVAGGVQPRLLLPLLAPGRQCGQQRVQGGVLFVAQPQESGKLRGVAAFDGAPQLGVRGVGGGRRKAGRGRLGPVALVLEGIGGQVDRACPGAGEVRGPVDDRAAYVQAGQGVAAQRSSPRPARSSATKSASVSSPRVSWAGADSALSGPISRKVSAPACAARTVSAKRTVPRACVVSSFWQASAGRIRNLSKMTQQANNYLYPGLLQSLLESDADSIRSVS